MAMILTAKQTRQLNSLLKKYVNLRTTTMRQFENSVDGFPEVTFIITSKRLQADMKRLRKEWAK